MPSKSLVSSRTAPVPSPESHAPHVPHAACPGNLHLSHTRPPVLRHLHGLWKGFSFPRKRQSASDAVLRRASSTINMPGAMLVSMTVPPPSPIISSPSSPTTPRPSPFPRGEDTNRPAIIAEVDPGSRSFKCLSPVVPLMRQGAGPSITVSSTQPSPVSDHRFPLTYMTTSISQPATAFRAPASGSILDATTRLQHFRVMIAEMRATLLRYDLEAEEGEAGFHTGNSYDNDDDDGDDRERERVLRLLEDVTRKVKRLADKDAIGLGRRRPVTIIETEIVHNNSLQ